MRLALSVTRLTSAGKWTGGSEFHVLEKSVALICYVSPSSNLTPCSSARQWTLSSSTP